MANVDSADGWEPDRYALWARRLRLLAGTPPGHYTVWLTGYDAVTQAIGHEAPPPPSLQGLLAKETRCARLEASADAIRAHIRETLEAASL